ncbi:galactose-1-epimerase [Chelonobacter oris]|uniref:galactose-1-epimerase n=1 Tax=Chelonobacter oris TaxID=505317 RepID=UPI00244982E7|nr:galactose-1-epimerase [Chelonobacter oris]MDH3000801.1 galactose-1-epimerase [Chelonobacter oris]
MICIYSEQSAPDGNPFQVVELSNANGMCVKLTDWGATWLTCRLPVAGRLRDVILGCETLVQHSEQGAYLGATIGRFANRIANAAFNLNGKRYLLDANQQQQHQLHGGTDAFDKRRWQISAQGDDYVEFGLLSADGDQGFPGNLHAKVRYRLRQDNALAIEFEARSDQDTPLNLTNHAYFNLDGESADQTVLQHRLRIAADHYLPVDAAGIPNAPLREVEKGGFDFRHAKVIAQDFLSDSDQQAVSGYDHAFLLNAPGLHAKAQVELQSSNGDLRLKIVTDQPAIQVYSGNFLAGTPNRSGGVYANHAGVALETQSLPDTPNHPEWFQYGGISKAGELYRKTTVFLFQAS